VPCELAADGCGVTAVRYGLLDIPDRRAVVSGEWPLSGPPPPPSSSAVSSSKASCGRDLLKTGEGDGGKDDVSVLPFSPDL